MSPEQIRDVFEAIKANYDEDDPPAECRFLLRNRRVVFGWFTGVSANGLVAVYRLNDPDGRPTWVSCQEIVTIEERREQQRDE